MEWPLDSFLGISVTAGDPGELLITGIDFEGLLHLWNEEHPDQQARLGDAIYEVNGVRGSAVDLAKALRSSGQMQFRLRRTDAGIRRAFSVFAGAVERRTLQEGLHTLGQGNRPEVEDGIDFVITVDRAEGDRLGIEVDSIWGWLLCIMGIAEDGLIAGWNASNRHMQVLPGDFLVTVNSMPCESKPEIFELLRKPGRLRLGLRRARLAAAVYEVDLQKGMYNETRLGLDIDASDPTGLFITGISVDGIAAEWNERHPEVPILPGDVITCVNGLVGDAPQMIKHLTIKRHLVLRLLRNSEYRLARMLDVVTHQAGKESGRSAAEAREQQAAEAKAAKAPREPASGISRLSSEQRRARRRRGARAARSTRRRPAPLHQRSSI